VRKPGRRCGTTSPGKLKQGREAENYPTHRVTRRDWEAGVGWGKWNRRGGGSTLSKHQQGMKRDEKNTRNSVPKAPTDKKKNSSVSKGRESGTGQIERRVRGTVKKGFSSGLTSKRTLDFRNTRLRKRSSPNIAGERGNSLTGSGCSREKQGIGQRDRQIKKAGTQSEKGFQTS